MSDARATAETSGLLARSLADVANATGRLLNGAYRLDGLIGRGGMGAVYRAVQLSVNRPVAIKLLSMAEADEEGQQMLLRRFEREAVATSRLSHPNTVRLFDFGESEGIPFLVLELLEGRSLRHRLLDGGALPSRDVHAILHQIASSLTEAHSHGIVHRDLKPDNIFLTRITGAPDLVKVMDFGIAAWRENDTNLTGQQIIGTVRYMAPEQLTAGEPDAATDVYALGCVAFEMLTGAPPFQGRPETVMARHLMEPRPDLPAELEPAWGGLLDLMLAKPQHERFQTMEAFLVALDALRESVAGLAVPDDLAAYHERIAHPPSTGVRGPRLASQRGLTAQETGAVGVVRQRTRGRAALWALLVLLLMAVGVAFGLALGGSRPDDLDEPVEALAPEPTVAAEPEAADRTPEPSPPAVLEEAAVATAPAGSALATAAPAPLAAAGEPGVVAVAGPDGGSAVEAAPPAPPPRVLVRFETRPLGARILIMDGDAERELCALTPCEVELAVRPQAELFVARHPRFQPARLETALKPGKKRVVEMVLKPKRRPTTFELPP